MQKVLSILCPVVTTEQLKWAESLRFHVVKNTHLTGHELWAPFDSLCSWIGAEPPWPWKAVPLPVGTTGAPGLDCQGRAGSHGMKYAFLGQRPCAKLRDKAIHAASDLTSPHLDLLLEKENEAF